MSFPQRKTQQDFILIIIYYYYYLFPLLECQKNISTFVFYVNYVFSFLNTKKKSFVSVLLYLLS